MSLFARPSNPHDRRGELIIQDDFQRGVEAGLGGGLNGPRVLLWNQAAHGDLRHDPHLKTRRSLVLMGSLAHATDRAYGAIRKDVCVNVVGLIQALEEVNGTNFQAWLEEQARLGHPVGLTVRQLAERAASHLADLYESTRHGERTGTWRFLLAFGEAYAWEQVRPFFGPDPRVLLSSDIPGSAADARPLPYRPTWSAAETVPAFLDIPPAWLAEEMGSGHLAVLAQAQRCRTEAPRQNHHTWIREWSMGEAHQERPDFVLFIQGLPVLWVEAKTPEATLRRALQDFQTKSTYQGAPLALAINGQQAILTSQVKGKVALWTHYEGNLGSRVYPEGKSQAYLVEEVLSKPDRMEFLVRHTGALDKEHHYLSARAQQYQALAHWERDLNWFALCQAERKRRGEAPLSLGNRLIQHTQRTGKTKTMARAVHLALTHHPDLFRMALVMVGEVLILGQIHEEMKIGNLGLADRHLAFQRIESRQQLNMVLRQERGAQTASGHRVLLVNMQKIHMETATDEVVDSDKVLMVLDESHLGQTSSTAQVRDAIFPHATHLLVTATPKPGMRHFYGLNQPWHTLDRFGFAAAQAAGMVCPVIYQRHSYGFKDHPDRIRHLAKALEKVMADSGEFEEQTLSLLDADAEQMKGQSLRVRSLVSPIRRQLEREVIPERLDAIVDALEAFEAGLVPGAFVPRALIFARDTASAREIIEHIQAQHPVGIPAHERNCYRGRRFAMDVSNFGKDPQGNERTFQAYNPGVVDEADLKNRLQSMDPSLRIDGLIAVGKYTKGYDNDQLSVVVALKSIREHSLINQIITRTVTQREGKAKGVFLDLSFGLDNLITWKASSLLYDQPSDQRQWYDQAKVEALVETVRQGLEDAARVARTDLLGLAQVGRVLEALDPARHQDRARDFIQRARAVTGHVAHLPDASVFRPLRVPLLGLRQALQQLRAYYPDLFVDESLQGNRIDLGPASLGQMLNQALDILGQSSLKALLDLGVNEDKEIIANAYVNQLAYQAAAKATHSAISEIIRMTLQNANADDLSSAPSPVLEALQRALAQIQDDLDSLGRGEWISTRRPTALDKGKHALDTWIQNTPHGGLAEYLQAAVSELIQDRARLLGLSPEQAMLKTGQPLTQVIRVASINVANRLERWESALSEGWLEHEPEAQARQWFTYQGGVAVQLSDYILEASRQAAGEDAHSWQKRLMEEPLRKELLCETSSRPELVGLPPLMARALAIALTRRANLNVPHLSLPLSASAA